MTRTQADTETTMPTVSDHIRRIRHEAGLSQYQLADAVGVTRSQVQQWERGARTPSVRRLLQIADVLSVPPGALLAGVSGE